jgi:hypothetical protein
MEDHHDPLPSPNPLPLTDVEEVGLPALKLRAINQLVKVLGPKAADAIKGTDKIPCLITMIDIW